MFPSKPKLKSDRPRKKEVFGLTESVLSALISDFPINELSRDLMDIHILSKFHDGKSIHRIENLQSLQDWLTRQARSGSQTSPVL